MSDNIMFDYIPGYFRTAKNFKKIMDAVLKQFDKVDDAVQDIINQIYVDTSTWGLQYWENDYKLEHNLNLTIEERRSRIKAKIRGTGKTDRKLIQKIAEAYSNGEVSVGFNGKIIITFIGTRGIPSALDELKKQLAEIRPSGLDIVYFFTYLSWNEFDALDAETQESMTWDQLEVYRP